MKPARTAPGQSAYPGPAWQSQPWSGRASRPPPLERLGRLIARRRRLAAALLLCLAAALAVQQLTPGGPATTTVMVAARDLPAGHVLGAGDLAPANVSPRMVPDGALLPESGSPAAWAGSQTSGPVRRHEVLTDASLLGAGLLTGAPAGSQAVPIRLSDPATLALLRQGQLVTVVLSSGAGLDGPVNNEVLAENVPVLWTPALTQSGGGLFPAQENEGILVVAASAVQAVQLAGAISRGKVFLILLN
ncbi:SAF domain-containing protein [Arthrobacter sp. LAPM80]|uniref:SAF domain-containing protein n=1 Tax=Arthrobacter sp. LAPM80 TaxID=3141788 RepID=UPI00398AAF99